MYNIFLYYELRYYILHMWDLAAQLVQFYFFNAKSLLSVVFYYNKLELSLNVINTPAILL